MVGHRSNGPESCINKEERVLDACFIMSKFFVLTLIFAFLAFAHGATNDLNFDSNVDTSFENGRLELTKQSPYYDAAKGFKDDDTEPSKIRFEAWELFFYPIFLFFECIAPIYTILRLFNSGWMIYVAYAITFCASLYLSRFIIRDEPGIHYLVYLKKFEVLSEILIITRPSMYLIHFGHNTIFIFLVFFPKFLDFLPSLKFLKDDNTRAYWYFGCGVMFSYLLSLANTNFMVYGSIFQFIFYCILRKKLDSQQNNKGKL